ncbi:MAG: hypothetical protein IBJ11_07015 [Phycisphaerales bacterium]|nr:hypothetical protein [Phycisphaerales bacterium]
MQDHPAPLIYAGIDEAGYGPTLGPLCVGLAVFEVGAWSPAPAAGPPDLWALLRAAVGRDPADLRRHAPPAVLVNDSKRLKLANDTKSRHPLTHLERGVLAFLPPEDAAPIPDDAALFRRLGVALDHRPWYAGDPLPLPASTTADHVRLLASRVAAACDAAAVRPLDLRCLALDESAFNARLAEVPGKARVSFELVAAMLARVWRGRACVEGPGHHAPRVVVDRQGGRTAYGPLLAEIFPGAGVRVLGETDERSVYEIRREAGPGPGPGDEARLMRISFEVEAEQRHLPVALASMTAKLIRELAMARFNRYWGGRVAELKPTAGYATDARRWLRDAGANLTAEERQALIRRA